VDLADIKLEIGKMLPLGMIVNELISNSVKHAFSTEKNPEIFLSINKKDEALHVNYSDNGSGFTTNDIKSEPSFGMDLIKTLISDLESEFNFKSSEKGFNVNFSIMV